MIIGKTVGDRDQMHAREPRVNLRQRPGAALDARSDVGHSTATGSLPYSYGREWRFLSPVLGGCELGGHVFVPGVVSLVVSCHGLTNHPLALHPSARSPSADGDADQHIGTWAETPDQLLQSAVHLVGAANLTVDIGGAALWPWGG